MEFFRDDTALVGGVELVEFRLTYQGPLQSNGSVRQKHAIRREFHTQLRELWRVQEPLARWSGEVIDSKPPIRTMVHAIAETFPAIGGYRFVPLVTKKLALACELDVLFLRREPPGSLVKHGGDIDNRMKTLFDALRMPNENNQVVGSPTEGEDPFFVLLQDDSLVSKISITTDRLLKPPAPDIGTDTHLLDNVHLVIGVRVRVLAVNLGMGGSRENLGFVG